MNETTEAHLAEFTPEKVAALFPNIRDAIGFLKSPIFHDIMALVAATQTPGKDDDKDALIALLNDSGMTEIAGLINPLYEFVTTILAQTTKVAEANETIKLMASAPVNVVDMPNAQAKQWLADNRASARSGGHHIFGRLALRRAPEVLSLLRGESTSEQLTAIDPARLAKIIDILRVAIPILTVAGAAFPPLLVVSSILRMIVAFYDSKHVTTATTMSADGDKGLSLGDLL